MNSNLPERTPSPARKPPQGLLYNLQVVVSVAFFVATLFTAWTPTSLLPDSLTERIIQALEDQATPTAGFPTATPRPRPLIGLVVGHWGENNDPGAVCPDGLTEFVVNQEVATLVKQNLSDVGYDVELYQEFDPRLEQLRALALVSIHADSCEYINDEATGFKIAATLKNLYPERSARLTACLRDRYAKATGLAFNTNTVTIDMTDYHAFREINNETNAAIIEIGFLNLDRQILTKGQAKVARGISDGILCYVRNESVSTEE